MLLRNKQNPGNIEGYKEQVLNIQESDNSLQALVEKGLQKRRKRIALQEVGKILYQGLFIFNKILNKNYREILVKIMSYEI